ncbi:class I SAM-dependent methyltransferase [Streptantibioticus ferralitis]|uniref:Methyltransferase domain-containing protein n=1 Tax=Streptantibioticus ferralitis TaxID=236510 RepID=A0ABT5Z074_9ACTN|nr:class I SAM-dependent methyltransferase [Streptantibioticus ferralitis]MDF2257195.1 methyltransferase domain-containing protein [Streptantibioticus ferralitis]
MTMTRSPSATTWDAWAEEGRGYHMLTDTELAAFARHFPIRCGHVATDVGCGTGVFSRQLHRFGYDVTGIDFADTALRAARRTPLTGVRYLRHDLNQGDPPGLPIRGIDLVVCRLILPFLTDPAAWVRRVRDFWLRPGGRMYAVIPVVGEDVTQPGGMAEREIASLSFGWAQAVRYDLRGPLACLALRSTAT